MEEARPLAAQRWLVSVACMALGSQGFQLRSASDGSAARGSRNVATGGCTCSFTIDNRINEVYVDDADVTTYVTGNRFDWGSVNTISFPCSSRTLLAVKGFDAENGCNSGAFAMRCESTDPSSPWHYLVADPSWKVLGSECAVHDGTCIIHTIEPEGWYTQNFDDSKWETSVVSLRSPVGAMVGVREQICSTSGIAWLFRSPYLGTSWFVIKWANGDYCASFKPRCDASSCAGNGQSDAVLATCDTSDPYQLFKHEAGRLVSAAPGYRCVYMSTSPSHGYCDPVTLVSCSWTDPQQEWISSDLNGHTKYVNPATNLALDVKSGVNQAGNDFFACPNENDNPNREFDANLAHEYTVARSTLAAEARSVCAAGEMAMPKTAAEQTAMMAALASYSDLSTYVWIGGKFQDGAYKWEDGTPITGYTNWDGGQGLPQNGPGQPWLCMQSATGRWHDCTGGPNEYYDTVCHMGNTFATASPTDSPTESPTLFPTVSPTTAYPTKFPTSAPTNFYSATAVGSCTCRFTIDNRVQEVYVNDADVTSSVTGDRYSWSSLNWLSFSCSSRTLLAVKGRDFEGGCANGAFALRCESSDPSSPWHYLIADTSWRVLGSECDLTPPHDGTCSDYTNQPDRWYLRNFDDTNWEEPAISKRDPVGEKVKVGEQICSTSGEAWLFRSPYLGNPWFVIKWANGDYCASFKPGCDASSCAGTGESDAVLATCDTSDPYQLFKLEAGRLVSAAPDYRCVYMSTSTSHAHCDPLTLASCSWTDAKQEWVPSDLNGHTKYVNPAVDFAMDVQRGVNQPGTYFFACPNVDDNRNKEFDAALAKKYVIARATLAADSRGVCGGGQLVMPKTLEEQTAMMEAIAGYTDYTTSLTHYLWIGGKFEDGAYKWDDGTDIMGYTNWAANQGLAENGARQPYVCLRLDDGKWYDCSGASTEYKDSLCDMGRTSATGSPTKAPTPGPPPTPSPPTPSPPPPPEVTATGDPHVTNMRGDLFKLRRAGNVMLLQIPKGANDTASLLRIDAHARRGALADDCGPLYFDTINITGKWAFVRMAAGYHIQVERQRSNVQGVHHKQHFKLGPGIRIVISHGRTDTGVFFLNVRIADLSKANMPIGGLLAGDEHTWAEMSPSDCDQEDMSLLSISKDVRATHSSQHLIAQMGSDTEELEH